MRLKVEKDERKEKTNSRLAKSGLSLKQIQYRICTTGLASSATDDCKCHIDFSVVVVAGKSDKKKHK